MCPLPTVVPTEGSLMTWDFPGPTWMTEAVCKGLLWSSCIPTGRKLISWWQGLPSRLSAAKAAENGNKQSLTTLFPCCDLFTSPATSNSTSSWAASLIQVSRDFQASGSPCPGCQKEYLHSGGQMSLSAQKSRLWWAQRLCKFSWSQNFLPKIPFLTFNHFLPWNH